MNKKCTGCGNEIHPKRLEILPSTTKCVNCSTTGKKSGVPIMKGEGEDTYNETVIMEPEQYQKYLQHEEKIKKIGNKFSGGNQE